MLGGSLVVVSLIRDGEGLVVPHNLDIDALPRFPVLGHKLPCVMF